MSANYHIGSRMTLKIEKRKEHLKEKYLSWHKLLQKPYSLESAGYGNKISHQLKMQFICENLYARIYMRFIYSKLLFCFFLV